MVRRYTNKDHDTISEWCTARGVKTPRKDSLSSTGYIVDGIAAGFLYFTDSRLAILDCYISNPSRKPQERSDALNAITTYLLEHAKRNDCKWVKCDTRIESIKARALMHGFKEIGTFTAFIKEL